MKLKNDHRSKFPTLAAGKEKHEKNQGFNRIQSSLLTRRKISPVILNSYLTFNGVWTKRGVGHGIGLGHGVGSSLPSGLPVVSFLIKSTRVERVAGIKLLTRFSTSKGTKLWKSNILQHSVLKYHICCLRRHIPSQAINHDGRL